jgi:hypothetical protein
VLSAVVVGYRQAGGHQKATPIFQPTLGFRAICRPDVLVSGRSDQWVINTEEVAMQRKAYRAMKLREHEHLDAEQRRLQRRRAGAWARRDELERLKDIEPGAVEDSEMREAEKAYSEALQALSTCLEKLREVRDELELLTPISESIRQRRKQTTPSPPGRPKSLRRMPNGSGPFP